MSKVELQERIRIVEYEVKSIAVNICINRTADYYVVRSK